LCQGSDLSCVCPPGKFASVDRGSRRFAKPFTQSFTGREPFYGACHLERPSRIKQEGISVCGQDLADVRLIRCHNRFAKRHVLEELQRRGIFDRFWQERDIERGYELCNVVASDQAHKGDAVRYLQLLGALLQVWLCRAISDEQQMEG